MIPSALATEIKIAADNAHKITETSELKISAQQVFDALPVEEAISQAKKDVEAGSGVNPLIRWRRLQREYRQQSFCRCCLSGKKHEVNFNLLSSADVIANILDLISGGLIASE